MKSLNFLIKRRACEYLSRATYASIGGRIFLTASGYSFGSPPLSAPKFKCLAVDDDIRIVSVYSTV